MGGAMSWHAAVVAYVSHSNAVVMGTVSIKPIKNGAEHDV